MNRDSSKTIDVPMNEESENPVRFLQREEIKKETEELLDNLEDGNNVPSDVPLLQTAAVSSSASIMLEEDNNILSEIPLLQAAGSSSNACVKTEIPNEEENERSSLTISLKILETEQQTKQLEDCAPKELMTPCETCEDFVKCKNELIHSKEKIAQLEVDLACSSEKYKTLKGIITQLEVDFSCSKESSEKHKRRYRILKEMITEFKADFALNKESSEKYETLKEMISQLEADLACSKGSSEKYKKKYRTLKERIAQLEANLTFNKKSSEKYKTLNEMIAQLEADLACSKESSEKYKRKYRTLKERITQLEANLSCSKENSEKYKGKYRSLKRKFNKNGSEDFQLLGSDTLIEKEKLSLCRTNNYSMYVGDIMEVLFGREILANSSIRQVKGVKKNALETQVVNDIQEHVALKFQMPVQTVRAAMRQKLNTCGKRMKKNK